MSADFAFAHLTALLYAILVLRDSRSTWIFGGRRQIVLRFGLQAVTLRAAR
jgi:hypothetical protein